MVRKGRKKKRGAVREDGKGEGMMERDRQAGW